MLIKNFLKILLIPFKYLLFKYQVTKFGVNEKWLKAVYAEMINLDLEDFYQFGEYKLQAYGGTVHAISDEIEFTINENQNRVLYVHERVKDQWEEVYRTNRLFLDHSFYVHMTILEKLIDAKAKELLNEGIKP